MLYQVRVNSCHCERSVSGASSVVFAGLIPRLRQNAGVEIVDFRPGKNPFKSLAVALAPLLSDTVGDKPHGGTERDKCRDALAQRDRR